MVALPEEYGAIERRMSFDDAGSNFWAAARHGLRAQFTWVDGRNRHSAARKLQEAVAAELNPASQPPVVKCAVRWGKPYREILSYATEQELDLVCMGAHGAEYGMSTLFGSNVDRVLRQAPCPVLVARPLKPATFVRQACKADAYGAALEARGNALCPELIS